MTGADPERRRAFQSTPLREGRLRRRLEMPGLTVGFNPRPCVRGDERRPDCQSSVGFNPRPCVRGDRRRASSGQSSFNPRPCVRGDSR